MIVTCESCQSRYLVPDRALGSEGRRVRCMVCDHEWYQDPEDGSTGLDDDLLDMDVKPDIGFEDENDTEDLLDEDESLDERIDDIQVPALPEQDIPPHAISTISRVTGYGAAVAVFGVIFGGLVVMSGTMTKIWPASAGFYEAVGVKTTVPGEALLFEKVSAVATINREDLNPLVIKGSVINLKSKTTEMPAIRASLRKAEGEVYTSWTITPEQSEIGPDASMNFSSGYPDVPQDVRELNLQLTAMHKYKSGGSASDDEQSLDGEGGDEKGGTYLQGSPKKDKSEHH